MAGSAAAALEDDEAPGTGACGAVFAFAEARGVVGVAAALTPRLGRALTFGASQSGIGVSPGGRPLSSLSASQSAIGSPKIQTRRSGDQRAVDQDPSSLTTSLTHPPCHHTQRCLGGLGG